MNKITFREFLDANNLPSIGEIVTTPSGFKVEVVAYIFDEMEDCVWVRCENEMIITWYFDQFDECTWEGKK